MSIGIDVRHACRKERTGKGQWVYGFVQELLRRPFPTVLFSDSPPPEEWKHVPCVLLPRGPRWHLAASSYLRHHLEITHWFSPTSFILPAFASVPEHRSILIHDLIAFHSDPHELRAKLIERALLPRALLRSTHIFTVSETTKRDLIKKFPFVRNVTVLGAGSIQSRFQSNIPDGRTILCMGTLCPRKNQLRLIEAYRRLPDALRNTCRLVLAGGRGWQDADIVQAARNVPGVEWMGYVDARTYTTLLEQSTIFAFPSLYEGFGMAVLDALTLGIPVLTSSRGSLAEVAGDAALVVDPEDVASIAAGLERLLTDSTLQQQLRQDGPKQAASFTWQMVVERFLAEIQRT